MHQMVNKYMDFGEPVMLATFFFNLWNNGMPVTCLSLSSGLSGLDSLVRLGSCHVLQPPLNSLMIPNNWQPLMAVLCHPVFV